MSSSITPDYQTMPKLLTTTRVTFSLGTATSCGHGSRLYAMNAGTKATCPTTTGRCGLITPPLPLSLMEATQAFLEMVSTLLAETPAVYLIQADAL
jgi:hypothetical protein